jgi:hypothetical protein
MTLKEKEENLQRDCAGSPLAFLVVAASSVVALGLKCGK